MPKQWMYVLALFFVIFLIYNAPAESGTAARAFVGWWGNLAEGGITFVDNLTDDTPRQDAIDATTTTFTGFNSGESFGPSSN